MRGRLSRERALRNGYAESDEAVEKLDYYLRHENKRRRISEAFRRRFLAEETLDKRLREMVKIVSDGSNDLD
ncbi:MAG: glycosyltransferase family 1 protein [Chlorobi bacterium]|nr:glycosyltransferase family 1 protein [Chlorobiota bacterium]